MDSAYYLFPFLPCPFLAYNFIQSVATFMFFLTTKRVIMLSLIILKLPHLLISLQSLGAGHPFKRGRVYPQPGKCRSCLDPGHLTHHTPEAAMNEPPGRVAEGPRRPGPPWLRAGRQVLLLQLRGTPTPSEGSFACSSAGKTPGFAKPQTQGGSRRSADAGKASVKA